MKTSIEISHSKTLKNNIFQIGLLKNEIGI